VINVSCSVICDLSFGQLWLPSVGPCIVANVAQDLL
jgi:hypothetical protein